jgi:hypothetical protein
MHQYTDDDINSYAASKGIVPGTLLWAANVPLSEEAFRGGNKTVPNTHYLRVSDLVKGQGGGRIPEAEQGNWVVNPGQGVSLFIKKKIPQAMIYIGAHGSPEVPSKGKLEKQYDPLAEVTWWKIEQGQVIPSGLQLVFDGEPPGHCTLTVERPMKLSAFLELVALVHFQNAGTEFYGTAKQ